MLITSSYAIKCINTRRLSNFDEIKILQRIRSPYLIRLCGEQVFIADTFQCIVIEYCKINN